MKNGKYIGFFYGCDAVDNNRITCCDFFAGNGVKNNGHKNNYGTEGMCIGMCFGSILSMLLESHQGIGLPLGMLIGLVIGRCIKKSKL